MICWRIVGFGMVMGVLMVVQGHAQNYDSIRADLEKDHNISLVLRQSVWPTIQKYGNKSRQIDSLNRLMERFDRTALERTIYVIDHCGWVGKSKIGDVANQSLFLMILHARDKKVREKYFPLLEKSARVGESSLSDMATMQDRILIESGHKQFYGTQRNLDGKLLPVEDPDKLNDRRKLVGLKKIIEKVPK